MLPTPKPTNRRRTAFTIVELLVVIGIIIILMGILLPVVKKVRYAAYTADTQNEISQISNACNQYYSTFHAYPGPLSNDYIEGVNAPTPGTIAAPTAHRLTLFVPGNPPSYSPFANASYPITGTENLVLGLMGGLRLNPTATDNSVNQNPPPPALAFAPTDVGLGPLNLNSLNPGRAPSFLTTGSNYLLWCQTPGSSVTQNAQYNSAMTLTPFRDGSQTPANDSPIPEFVDRYPSPGPLPILYIRARTGAHGVVSDGTITDAVLTSQTALYQYDLREITPYTNTHIGLVADDNSGNAVTHNLLALSAGPAPSSPPVAVTKAGVYYTTAVSPKPADSFSYFVNSSIPPTNISDPNYYGRPRAVDTFILISAGPDGIYGTADDITSFGDVSQ